MKKKRYPTRFVQGSFCSPSEPGKRGFASFGQPCAIASFSKLGKWQGFARSSDVKCRNSRDGAWPLGFVCASQSLVEPAQIWHETFGRKQIVQSSLFINIGW